MIGRHVRVMVQMVIAGLACVSSASAQNAPVITKLKPYSERVKPGELVMLKLEVRPAADANASTVLASIDPMGVADYGFVHKFNREDLSCPDTGPCSPCPADQQCFTRYFFVDIRTPPGRKTMPVGIVDAKGRETRTSLSIMVEPLPDSDGDGMSDLWEGTLGLNSASALGEDGANGDPDDDGVPNREEYRRGSHPRGRHVLYFGELSGGERQRLSSSVQRYQPERGPVLSRMFGDDGRTASVVVQSELGGGAYMGPAGFVADRVVAVIVESEHPFVASRESRLGELGEVASVSSPMAAPSTSWYFADGGTSGVLDLFLLTYNPNPDAVEAEFTYLRGPGLEPIVKRRMLPPGVRTTIWSSVDEPELKGAEVAPIIRTSAPILAERAWRASPPGKTVPHDNASPGVTQPSSTWYFPQLPFGDAFDSALVVANPNAEDAEIEVVGFFSDREPLGRRFAVPARSRTPLPPIDFGPAADAGVSIRVTTSSGTPVVVERSVTGQPTTAAWRHAATGATATSTKWGFPRVSVGTFSYTPDLESLVITNPSDTDAQVELKFYENNFEPTTYKAVFTVPARRRLRILTWPDPPGGASGGMIATSLPQGTGGAPGVVIEYTRISQVGGEPRVVSLIGSPMAP